jgi:hypothetical protein
MQSKDRCKRSLIVIGVSLALLALFAANARHPTILTDNPRVNLWIGSAVLLLPWVAAMAAVYGFPSWWKLCAVLLSPLMLFSLIYWSLNARDLSVLRLDGNLAEIGELSRLRVPDGSELAVYYLDAGAVLTLRHERSLVGPLRLVQVVVTRVDDAEMTPHLVDAHHVEVDGKQYRLLRHVVF